MLLTKLILYVIVNLAELAFCSYSNGAKKLLPKELGESQTLIGQSSIRPEVLQAAGVTMDKRTFTNMAWFKAPETRENFKDFSSYSWQEPIPTFLTNERGETVYITKIVTNSSTVENGSAKIVMAFASGDENDYEVSFQHAADLTSRLKDTGIVCKEGWDNNFMFEFKLRRKRTFTEAAVENAKALVERIAINQCRLDSPAEVTKMDHVWYEDRWVPEGYYLAYKHGIVDHLPSK
jgi:hypothetical protein